VAIKGSAQSQVGTKVRKGLTQAARDEAPWSEPRQVDWFKHRREESPKAALELDALTIEELLARTDAELCEAINRRVADQDVRRGYWRLPIAARNILLVERLYAEVMGGGFHQFFSSAAGNFADDTAEAVDAVGMPVLVEIYRRALAVLPTPPSRDRAERVDEIAGLKGERKAWSAVDAEFYASFREGDAWHAGVATYIRSVAKGLELDVTERQRCRAILEVVRDLQPAPSVERLEAALSLRPADKRREKLLSLLQMKDTTSERKLHAASMADRLEGLRALGYHVASLVEATGSLQRVRHTKFGDGMIESQDGEKLVIRFKDGSVRKLASQFVHRL
jgi:hypothetical protein